MYTLYMMIHMSKVFKAHVDTYELTRAYYGLRTYHFMLSLMFGILFGLNGRAVLEIETVTGKQVTMILVGAAIACIGVFGLLTDNVKQRIKELQKQENEGREVETVEAEELQ